MTSDKDDVKDFFLVRLTIIHFTILPLPNSTQKPNPNPTHHPSGFNTFHPNSNFTSQVSTWPTLVTHRTPPISTSPKLSHQTDPDHAPWCEAKEPHKTKKTASLKSWGQWEAANFFWEKWDSQKKVNMKILYTNLMVHFSFLSKYQVLLQISRLHQRGHIEIHHYVIT